jgi:hypothetical protein
VTAGFIDATANYYLHDWLDLHGLTARQGESVLSRMGDRGSDCDADAVCSRPCNLSGERAWQLAADAMLSSFPQAAGPIEHARDKAVRTFRADGARAPRPFTVPTGRDDCPAVVLSYRGRIVDLITVAHEFGHAVQIAATGGGFVPPVNREICAFVSELALLKLLLAELPALHRPALAGWRAGNRNYLGRHGKALALALSDPQSVYRYCWNYPIARVLASECMEHLPAAARWSIFENRIPLSGIVRFLDCGQRNSRSCTGACLAIEPAMNYGPATPVQ